MIIVGTKGGSNLEEGNTVLGLEGREAGLLRSSPGWTWW